MICPQCYRLMRYGGPPCCTTTYVLPPAIAPLPAAGSAHPKSQPDYGFDHTKLLGSAPVDFSAVTRNATKMISEAIEKLLKEWVESGLPLDRANPKWEFSLAEDRALNVRVWIEWLELPTDVQI